MVTTTNENSDFSKMKIQMLSSVADLSNPVCSELYSYWSDLMSAGALQNFDLIDIPKVIPFALVLEYEDDEQSFRVKMSGQSIVEASRHDLTGKILGTDDGVAPLTTRICQMILECQSPVFSSDGFSAEALGKTLHFEETIALPLFGPAGNLAQIILVHGPE